MSSISNLRKDYLASNIRSQVNTLNSIINNMEAHDYSYEEFADESLQRVIIGLVKLRRNVKGF